MTSGGPFQPKTFYDSVNWQYLNEVKVNGSNANKSINVFSLY